MSLRSAAHRFVLLLALACVWAGGPAFSARAAEAAANTPLGRKHTASPDNPAYDYEIANGLYATLTAIAGLPKAQIQNEKTLKLKKVEGFPRELQVRVARQAGPAPLAVVLLGLASRSKDPLARLWAAQLQEAGCHVLVFDSVFRPSFNEKSRHGAAGNLRAEAQAVARVVEAVMRHPDLEGQVTQVGLVGASYGGMVALHVARLAQEGQIALRPARVLACSPPVSLRASAGILDRFHDEERMRFDLWSLSKMKGHKPVSSGQPVPFPADLMRAGIGFAFRADLEDALASTEELYQFRLEPEAATLGENTGSAVVPHAFRRFLEEAVFPYWKKQGAVKSMEELWALGELGILLKGAPQGIRVILTEDDPLNEPAALAALRAGADSARLTVLPRGGHLGYACSRWAKARVQRLFE